MTAQIDLVPDPSTPPVPALDQYDALVVSLSGGKDSQAMLDYLVEIAPTPERLVAVTADLGEAEWPGTTDFCQTLCASYGIPYHVVRPVRPLLEAIARRGRWPAAHTRYCTSDGKRAPIDKFIRRRWPRGRVLLCTGERREESPRRARKPAFERIERVSRRGRTVDLWRPILDWSLAQVWTRIRASGRAPHYAYDLGMQRLSCSFCVFGSKADLLAAKAARPELYRRYVELEQAMGHTFRHRFPLAALEDNPDDGHTGPC